MPKGIRSSVTLKNWTQNIAARHKSIFNKHSQQI